MHRLSVSVVIPAYRAAGTIGRAVKSVLAQTVLAAEIIVIDDGSPDDLAAALAPFGDRVTCLQKENGGAASARNLGIEKAQGDFIAFLDADDYWEPDKIERQLQVFEKHPEVGLVAGQYFAEPPGAERTLALDYAADWFDRSLNVGGERAFMAAMIIWTGTLLVRRAVLGDERFVEGLETAEDRDLWTRLVSNAPCFLLSEPLATAVLEPGSLSRSSVSHDCSNMLHVVRRHRKLLGKKHVRMWEALTYYRWGACEPEPRVALAKLLRSLWLWPFPFRRELVVMPYARPKAILARCARCVGFAKSAKTSALSRPQKGALAD